MEHARESTAARASSPRRQNCTEDDSECPRPMVKATLELRSPRGAQAVRSGITVFNICSVDNGKQELCVSSFMTNTHHLGDKKPGGHLNYRHPHKIRARGRRYELKRGIYRSRCRNENALKSSHVSIRMALAFRSLTE